MEEGVGESMWEGRATVVGKERRSSGGVTAVVGRQEQRRRAQEGDGPSSDGEVSYYAGEGAGSRRDGESAIFNGTTRMPWARPHARCRMGWMCGEGEGRRGGGDAEGGLVRMASTCGQRRSRRKERVWPALLYLDAAPASLLLLLLL